MVKRNKWMLIASSIVILLPMLLGIFGDALLPERFAVHWGLDGTADGYAGRSVFFILPPILLAIHWACVLLTAALDKNAEQNQKMMRIVLWILPAISLSSTGMIVSAALGSVTNAFALVYLLLGVMFIVIGNYMPKTTRSLTTGIKIKWTYASDENWNATHRFAGKVYVAVGFVSLLCIPLPAKALPFVMIGIILIAVLLPVIYSYRFYKKQLADGSLTREQIEQNYREIVKNPKSVRVVSIVILAVVATVFPILMFTGKIEAVCGEDALLVEASFAKSMTLSYDEIDSVEYREGRVDGVRVYGFASGRLLLGTFQNEELGTYTRYTYTGDKPCVVIKAGERYVVVGTNDAASTKEIYDRISSEIAD